MPNILDILARAQSLKNETALNSITPPRAGGIMYDTLLVLNQMQLEGASLLISKVYASVSAMEADTTPTSDLTGRALKPGQLVVIVTSDSSSSDMGSEYRYNGPGSWTYVGKVGGLPLDTVPTQSSTKGITSGAVFQIKKDLGEQIDQLAAELHKVAIPITATGMKINTNGAIGSTLPAASANASYNLMKYPVVAGDIIYVNAKGGSAPRAWCFADSDEKILSQAPYSTSQVVETLVAPENAAWIVINDTSNSTSYYLSKDALLAKIGKIRVAQADEEGYTKTDITDSTGETKSVYSKVDGLNIYIPDSSIPQIETYESCIKEIWVDTRFLTGLPYVHFRCYNNHMYLGAKATTSASSTWMANVAITNDMADGMIIPLVVSDAGGSASVGDVVGYVIFSDIATFKATATSSTKCFLSAKARCLDYNRGIWYGTRQTEESIEKFVSDAVSGNLDVVLPSIIYASVGVQLNLYNDAVALSMDKGLSSPANYIVRWSCSRGTIANRCFRFTPKASDIGDTILYCYVYTIAGVLVVSKQCTIRVVAHSIAAQKNILFVGDSTGEGSANALHNDFADSSIYDGVLPVFNGTKGATPKWEGFGGARWADFATEGRAAYRCQVSGVGPIALNSRYTNNGYTWTIVEVNVTDGVGNILITKNDLMSNPVAPQTNGILVSTDGGEDIPYTNATLAPGNPFWHNGAIDFAHYRSNLGLAAKLDVVMFQLGLNGYEDISVTQQYIADIYAAAVADNPNCLVILGLVTGPANSVDAYGVNYGAGDWLSSITKYHSRRKMYVEMAESGNYPNLRIATPNLNIDRYYGFPLGTRAVSARDNATEEYHSNFVHPSSSGYAQIGDAFFAAVIATMNE